MFVKPVEESKVINDTKIPTNDEYVKAKPSTITARGAPPKNNPDGYRPPSEHATMAEKARNGQLSKQEFNKYVSNVDKAPPGSNLAALESGSDTEHQEMSDIEF
ncbi:hypothetical protein AYI69_g8115 [Smittium culicis]|uniref:Uncharacterized protein n=1 Tax=Smittium culicis TaxID=133412 RepID=A0A1R1XM32_9FUNG|nr:hypothetical protein AYI69_g8115 [Smittium culicis]